MDYMGCLKAALLLFLISTIAYAQPKPAVGLTPGTYSYKVKLTLGAQNMEMAQTTTVKEDGATFVVTQVAKTPQGDNTDTAVIDKVSLQLLKHTVKAGPMTIDVAIKDGKLSGKISGMGPDRPIEADAGGPIFADACDMFLTLAALPLTDGYTATYRNFDVARMKASKMQVTVGKPETITVAAGKFDTVKMEVGPAEGAAGNKATVWVDTKTHKPVKISQAVVTMGGATIDSELQP